MQGGALLAATLLLTGLIAPTGPVASPEPRGGPWVVESPVREIVEAISGAQAQLPIFEEFRALSFAAGARLAAGPALTPAPAAEAAQASNLLPLLAGDLTRDGVQDVRLVASVGENTTSHAFVDGPTGAPLWQIDRPKESVVIPVDIDGDGVNEVVVLEAMADEGRATGICEPIACASDAALDVTWRMSVHEGADGRLRWRLEDSPVWRQSVRHAGSSVSLTDVTVTAPSLVAYPVVAPAMGPGRGDTLAWVSIDLAHHSRVLRVGDEATDLENETTVTTTLKVLDPATGDPVRALARSLPGDLSLPALVGPLVADGPGKVVWLTYASTGPTLLEGLDGETFTTEWAREHRGPAHSVAVVAPARDLTGDMHADLWIYDVTGLGGVLASTAFDWVESDAMWASDGFAFTIGPAIAGGGDDALAAASDGFWILDGPTGRREEPVSLPPRVEDSFRTILVPGDADGDDVLDLVVLDLKTEAYAPSTTAAALISLGHGVGWQRNELEGIARQVTLVETTGARIFHLVAERVYTDNAWLEVTQLDAPTGAPLGKGPLYLPLGGVTGVADLTRDGRIEMIATARSFTETGDLAPWAGLIASDGTVLWQEGTAPHPKNPPVTRTYPDLVPVLMLESGRVWPGETARLRFGLDNMGTQDAPPARVELWHNGERVDTATIDSRFPFLHTHAWTASETDAFELIVDPADDIKETNETNNRVETSFHFSGPRTFFSDSLETGAPGWEPDQAWTLVTDATGDHAWSLDLPPRDPDSFEPRRANLVLPPVDAADAAGVRMAFNHVLANASGSSAHIDWKDASGEWREWVTFGSEANGPDEWTLNTGGELRLRFRYETFFDQTPTWRIDDILIAETHTPGH